MLKLNLSNKTKLAFNIITLLILGLFSSTMVSYMHVKNNLHEAVHNELTLIANTVAIKVNSWLESNLSVVTNLADTLANSPAPIRDNSNYEFFLNQTSTTPQLDFLSISLDKDGYFLVNDWEVPPDHDPRAQAWYKESKKTMEARISSSLLESDQERYIYIEATAPIIQGNNFLGVVAGEITLNNVQEIILNMDLGYDGFAFLVKKSGNILIHHSASMVGKSFFSLEDLSLEDKVEITTEGIIEGKEFLYSLTSIKHSDWYLIVAANKGQFNEVLTTKTLLLLLHFFAIFGVIMLLFLFLNRRIVSPIIDLLERDSVTNLPNKKNFKQQVTNHFLSQNIEGLLVIVSVDNFNRVTAAYSHQELGLLFNKIRRRMQSKLLHRSLLGYFSESRLVAYMACDNKMNGGAKLAWLQSLVDGLSASYTINGREIHCTFTIGACDFPDHGTGIENLIDNSFSAMADEKHNGVSSFGIFAPTMNQQLGSELLIINAMKNALRNNEFYMQYQPQYDYKRQELVGMEALIRWYSTELERTVSPGEFIPVAENTILIVLLGDFVIDSVIKQIKRWNDTGLAFGRVSINVSPKQLLAPDFTERLLAKLAQYDVNSNQLELEVTETSVLDDPANGIAILEKLSKAGFYISIDDFGTGYSSLEYLKLMPVNKLKIDRAFIRDLSVGSKDSAILKSIVDLASALDFHLLAEGVETKERLDIVLSSGCNVIQGYYYSKPIDAAEINLKLSEDILASGRNLANTAA